MVELTSGTTWVKVDGYLCARGNLAFVFRGDMMKIVIGMLSPGSDETILVPYKNYDEFSVVNTVATAQASLAALMTDVKTNML